ncbi:hypothetical protein GGP41_002722 [Bipolaris sorokiniana]|uniref:Extracellular membrane protein CFEM domain-containing protein n=2 Tax=Cochliobolus sativus TaxID=45130 RepID=A0A8H5ZJL6_COCSA|nr:uncharacterized protein COCSADRAFT_119439 [Bipolaris sorokiniana ND90Pr]EMD63958.1 hypothetical protein COCSADRAFT_119439 [Bipolaris sorokiniana ND90Pr]KAF5850492.1 hypothetical protein GGP41_002722 [Bipolaris sorokiniana]
MVRLSIFAVIFATVASVAADGYCQCLFPDGSHCCVVAYGIRKACVENCKNNGNSDRMCNAGGKYSDVSSWNAGWRRGCKYEYVV